MGDLFFALPAVHRIHECFPGAEVEWLVDSNLASLLEFEKKNNKNHPCGFQKTLPRKSAAKN